MGLGTTTLPVVLWYLIAAGAEAAARLVGKAGLKPFSKLRSRLLSQSYDSTMTEQLLGARLDFDWARALRASIDGQSPNFRLLPLPGPLPKLSLPSVCFIGYGRIVKQRHLPGLAALGAVGKIRAYDVQCRRDAESGQ